MNLPTIQIDEYLKPPEQALIRKGWKLRNIRFKKSNLTKECMLHPLLNIRTIDL